MSENERLKELQKLLGYSSQKEFAAALGIQQGSLSDIYRAKNGIGVSGAIKMSLSKMGVAIDWLETGEGPMLRNTTPVVVQVEDEEEDEDELLPRITENEGRPYYDIDFLGGYGDFLDDPSSMPVAYMIDYPPYNKEGVFYTNVLGDSMAPEFNGGDLIALRAIETWRDFLLLGKVYAIVTLGGQRTIKRLRKGSDREHYLLEAANPSYESQEIPLDQIERVFEVLGGIRRYE